MKFDWTEMNLVSVKDIAELMYAAWQKLNGAKASGGSPKQEGQAAEKTASTSAPPPASVSEAEKKKADEAEFGRLLMTLKAIDADSHKEILRLLPAIATVSAYCADDFRVFILNVPNRKDEIKKAMKGPAQGKGGTPSSKESTWVRDFTFTQRDARVQMLQYIAKGRKAIRGDNATKNALVIRWLTVETNFVKTISPNQAKWEAVKQWATANAPNLKVMAAIAVIGDADATAIITRVKAQDLGAGEQAEIERQLLAAMQQCNTAKQRALNLPNPQPRGTVKAPGKILSWWHIIPAGIIVTMIAVIAIK